MASDSGNAGYFASLGFDIDTSGLVYGQHASSQLAATLDKLATVVEKVSVSLDKPAKGAKRTGDEAKKTSDEIGRLHAAMAKAGQQFETFGGQFSGLAQHIGAMAQAFGSGSMSGLNAGLSSSLGLFGRVASSLGPVGIGLAGAATAATALSGAYAALISSTAVVQERYMLLEARLKNIYGSTAAARTQFEAITAVANKNGMAVEQTADAYLRLARNNEAIGLTRRQMVDLTDAVQMLGRVSNASGSELASGMMQFSQALASGRLGGDELRSIMENMPALAKAIADGMGITVGQLRAMGAAGELTGDKITNAILKQLPKIQKEFEGLPQTSDQAFTRLSNSWDSLLAHMGDRLESSGIMSAVARKADEVVKHVDELVNGASPEDAIAAQYNRARTAEQWLRRGGDNKDRWGYQSDLQEYEAASKRLNDLMISRQEDIRRKSFLAHHSGVEDESTSIHSSYTRSQSVVQEIDQQAKKLADLNTQLNTLQTAYSNFQKRPDIFSAEEAAKLQKYPGYIASVTQQIEKLGTALERSQRATAQRSGDLSRYGGGGGLGFGDDVRKLMEQSASEGSPISQSAAQTEVLRSHAQGVAEDVAALEAQVAAQRRTNEAIGKGTEAQIEAQVQQKAATYQFEKYGDVVGEQVAGPMAAYVAQLRALMAEQQAATDAQALFNAQQEVAIQKQLSAAQAAGANAGALRELEAQMRRNADMSQATAAGAEAIAAKAAAAQEARDRAELQKLSALRQDIEDRRTALNAGDPSQARQISQDAQARKYASDFGPDQQGAAYAAKLLELHTQDAEAIRRSIDDKERSVELQRVEIAAAQRGGIAGQIMLAKAKELNEIRASGLKLTDLEIAKRLRLAEVSVVQAEQLRQAQEQADAYKNIWTTAATSIGGAIDDVFNKVMDGQEIKVSEIVKRIVSQGGSATIQATITQPLTNIVTQFANSLRSGGGAGGIGAAIAAAAPSQVEASRMSMSAANSNVGGVTSVISRGVARQVAPSVTMSSVAPVAPQMATQRLTGYANNGSFSGVGAYAARGAGNVDPRLTDILRTAAERSGWKVQAFSGYRPGDPRFHGRGIATDIRLIDPATGRALDSPGHTGHYQSAQYYREYENFAQQARLVQMEKYPELKDRFRWGGYFSSRRGMHGYGALDGMHYDLGGGRLGMAAGSWEGGLNAMGRRAYPGINSVGMAQQNFRSDPLKTATNDITKFTQQFAQDVSKVTKSVDLKPIESLPPALTSVTKASASAVPAVGGFGNTIMSMLQQLIPSLGGGLLGSIFGSANGNVFEGGVRMYGVGGVVNRPLAFRTRGGVGVMGEAGPEAIMPLRRGPDGKLGVAGGAGGGGDVSVVINDMRSGSGAQPVEMQESKGPGGKRMLSVMIRDEVKGQMGRGSFDVPMKAAYGASRRTASR